MTMSLIGCHIFAVADIEHCGDVGACDPLGISDWSCDVWEEDVDGDLGALREELVLCGTFERGEDQDRVAFSSASSLRWTVALEIDDGSIGELWVGNEPGQQAGGVSVAQRDLDGGQTVTVSVAGDAPPQDWRLVLTPSG